MRPTLTGIRPSLWARCVTAAVFQGRGEPEAEPEAEAREWFFRGHVFEEIVMRQIEAKHGKENVQRQVEIPIPGIGTGHADGLLIPEKALIEIKSTVAAYPNSDTFQFGVEQLRRYLAYHGEAVKGYLYMVDPSRMKPADVYEVVLTDDDREAIEIERWNIEQATTNPGPLPDHGGKWRPCTRPSQARSRLCPFAAVCFEGWEPEPADEIKDPAALDAASRLYAIKEEKRQHAAAIRALEEGERSAQAELAEHVEPGEALVGPFAVKRTHVEMQPKFSVRAFQAAGHSLEALAEFFTPGTEYDRWTVAKAAEAGDVDFGEAPF
jgi:CRISPR/Cas system-associated exonuclease Cas4 (RecB family)